MKKFNKTSEQLRPYFRYNQETGKLFRLNEQTGKWIEQNSVCKERGYVWVRLHRCMSSRSSAKVTAQRIIACLMGYPDSTPDHINGIGSDNRLVNLRFVEERDNNVNKAMPSNNTSGQQGVVWHARDKKWLARISDGKKRIELGRFDNYDDAVAKRKAAELAYGYHENHGRLPPRAA